MKRANKGIASGVLARLFKRVTDNENQIAELDANKMPKTFSEIARTTGNTTMKIDLNTYSNIQILIMPNKNMYNEMTFSISTARLKSSHYHNLGATRRWYEDLSKSVYASVGFDNTGNITLEGCALDNGTDLLENSMIIVYGV